MTSESRKQRFKRIATKRTNDIIDKIRILSNCSNKSAYEYTNDEIDKIFSEIGRHLKQARAKFTTDEEGPFEL